MYFWFSGSNGLKCGSFNGIYLIFEFGGFNFSIFSVFVEFYFVLFTEKFEFSFFGIGKFFKFRFLKVLYLCKDLDIYLYI